MATNQNSTPAATDSDTEPRATALSAAVDEAWNLLQAARAERMSVREAFEEKIDSTKLSAVLPPVLFPEIDPRDALAPRTNTQARETVAALRKWMHDYIPRHSAIDAVDQIESLFVTAWTVNDESLGALMSFQQALRERAPDTLVARPGDGGFQFRDGPLLTGLDTALLMLHRWQDRGGMMGNVGLKRRAGHPIAELHAATDRLQRLYASADDLSSELTDGGDAVSCLAGELLSLLPEGSKEKALVNAILHVNNTMAASVNTFSEEIEDLLPLGGDLPTEQANTKAAEVAHG
jgi:hypothetical protein